MNRREFVIGAGAALVAASAALSLESCGGGGDGASPSPSAPGFDVTSNPDNTGHNHSVRILNADLSAPPAGGVIYPSTGSHIHTITLSQQQLIDIANGSAVTVVSSASGVPAHT